MNESTSYNPTLPTNIYQQYKMDMIVAYYLEKRLYEDKEVKKGLYISPKRDIMCSRCGQQYYWCTCKDKEDLNK